MMAERKIPFLKTGEVAFRNKHFNLEDLLRLDAANKAEHSPLTMGGVRKIFKATTNVSLDENVARLIGSDFIKHWELIFHPDIPSLLIIGGNEPENGRLAINDATTTILINRHIFHGTDHRVHFESARLAGMIPDTRTICEVTYTDPDLHTPASGSVPKRLRLEYFGISVSAEEITENPATISQYDGTCVYGGFKVQDEQGVYSPTYVTYPLMRKIGISYDFVSNCHGAAVITTRMAELAGPARMLRTRYNQWAKKGEHVLYLGGEDRYNGDPAGKAGFYSFTDPESSASVVGQRVKDLRRGVSWKTRLPIILR